MQTLTAALRCSRSTTPIPDGLKPLACAVNLAASNLQGV